MMAINNSASALGDNLVKLVAELRHLVGRVLVAGNDFIDGVNDGSDESFILYPSNQFPCQLIHRLRLAAQVPYLYVADIFGRNAQGFIYILEPVEAARPVQFQIHICNFPLGAAEPQPLLIFCYGNSQFDERERLARFAGSGNQHLVSLPQHSLDKFRGQLRHIIPYLGQVFQLRQVIIQRREPFQPFLVILPADVRGNQELFVSVANHAGQPG